MVHKNSGNSFAEKFQKKVKNLLLTAGKMM